MDAADTSGVLRGERRDDARPVATQRGECLQVRLKQAQESVNLSEVPAVDAVTTWMPAPPEGSLPAMVKTVGKVMVLFKEVLNTIITLQSPKRGKFAIKITPSSSRVTACVAERERLSRFLPHCS